MIAPDMGSGYGGKHTGEAAIEAARLAKAAGKPVKLNWTREEEFTWAYFRPAGVIESGRRRQERRCAHRLAGRQLQLGRLRPAPALRHSQPEGAFHPAQAPLRQGSYRALAATANHFARESHIDDLARAVKQDPLAFRLKNLKDARLKAVLEAAAKQFGWEAGKKPPAGHGYGIAGGSEKGSYVATCAEVAVDPASGKVRVVRLVTAFECGAIVNPDQLKNQVEGAAMMGLGGAPLRGDQVRRGQDHQREILALPRSPLRRSANPGDSADPSQGFAVRRRRRNAHRGSGPRNRQRDLSRDGGTPHQPADGAQGREAGRIVVDRLA